MIQKWIIQDGIDPALAARLYANSVLGPPRRRHVLSQEMVQE